MCPSPAMPGAHRQKGFTLIELLVVIAIIAILAAMLFPVFAKAREKSWQTACVSNQRQISVAAMMYVQDHDETFFPDSGAVAWSTHLAPYNESSIYDCPSYTDVGSSAQPEYGFNAQLFGRALGDVETPEDVLLVADLKMAGPHPNYAITSYHADIDSRHNGGTVLACVDGHANWENCNDGSALLALMGRGYELYPFGELQWESTGVITMPKQITTGLFSPTVAPLPEACYQASLDDPAPGVEVEFSCYSNAAGKLLLNLWAPETPDPSQLRGFFIGMDAQRYETRATGGVAGSLVVQPTGIPTPDRLNINVQHWLGVRAYCIGDLALMQFFDDGPYTGATAPIERGPLVQVFTARLANTTFHDGRHLAFYINERATAHFRDIKLYSLE